MKKSVIKRGTSVKEIIRKELVGMGGRLVTKMDDMTNNFKDYVDSRMNQVQRQVGGLKIDIRKIDQKIDVNTKGLVEMVERRIGEIDQLDNRVKILGTNIG